MRQPDQRVRLSSLVGWLGGGLVASLAANLAASLATSLVLGLSIVGCVGTAREAADATGSEASDIETDETDDTDDTPCELDPGPSACTSCLASSCCRLVDACVGDPACDCVHSCLATGDHLAFMGCASACDLDTEEHDMLHALFHCSFGLCQDACGHASVSFVGDVLPVLDRECGCHRPGAGGSGAPAGLNLDDDVAHEMLVGVPATGAPLDRVVPGRPDDSYLFHKLAGSHTEVGGGGARMPAGPEATALEPADRLAIESWILDGAQP